MQVHIKLLGVYRKHLPANAQGTTYNLEIAIDTRIEELLPQIPVPTDERQVVLINGRAGLPGQILKEGDTIALFPAVAGG